MTYYKIPHEGGGETPARYHLGELRVREKPKHWCDVGKSGKKRAGMHPRHYSFWAWGYDECPICGEKLGDAGVYKGPSASNSEGSK
tara:strand:- start:1179 stop:1436 length:258 start_codon:yes stop_codon:yes gene_type:complete